jgi:transposase-like protein
MPQPASRDPIYRRRRYSSELIEQCVRWYLTYRLSYRDLAAMMAERQVAISHKTVMRWVRHYVPEYERRWSRFSKPTDSSWRMDETSVSVGGRRNYLYRAVDRNGKSVHSLLREDRTIGSAQEFFRQAVRVKGSPGAKAVDAGCFQIPILAAKRYASAVRTMTAAIPTITGFAPGWRDLCPDRRCGTGHGAQGRGLR